MVADVAYMRWRITRTYSNLTPVLTSLFPGSIKDNNDYAQLRHMRWNVTSMQYRSDPLYFWLPTCVRHLSVYDGSDGGQHQPLAVLPVLGLVHAGLHCGTGKGRHERKILQHFDLKFRSSSGFRQQIYGDRCHTTIYIMCLLGYRSMQLTAMCRVSAMKIESKSMQHATLIQWKRAPWSQLLRPKN